MMRCNFLVKTTLVFFMLMVSSQHLIAQVYIIDEGFNGGTTPVSGWVFGGTITSSSGSGNFGRNAPNLTLGTSGVITYSWTGAGNTPDLVTFMYRGIGSSANCAGSSLTIQESSDNITYTVIAGTAVVIQSNFSSSFNGVLSATSRFVRITFNQLNTATCILDDFKIRKSGNCTSNPQIQLIVIDGGCVAGCEGGNEIVVAKNGNTALSVNNLELAIQSPGGSAPKGTTIGGNSMNSSAFWTLNTTYTAAQLAYISALTGTCVAGTFAPIPASNLIPANANMLLENFPVQSKFENKT